MKVEIIEPNREESQEETTKHDVWREQLKTSLEAITQWLNLDVEVVSVSNDDEIEEKIILKFKKEWEDNEAEIVDLISIIRELENQKKAPDMRMDYNDLFKGAWDFPVNEDDYLHGVPPELQQDEAMDTPLNELEEDDDGDD